MSPRTKHTIPARANESATTANKGSPWWVSIES
jgi:hypothetical protein